ncbi:uncharacterized protein Z519_12032 [Cladophialophora bantiana CBS 173.52]|uniref:Expansin-like EG45 domain-containing protein n=1 Tax=Cladophialophora bantiana (strain ATCC 10958 / CBS 173.52 / CDC B-1940 / NIH 8579) TaxID=1442370 RepID=A0A0D2EB91_CLAB1|nr:uncharacterized protein Z519_12032 [Cladophialophora bantiana CBS 173.52]KIW87396.1 hypothetical protein Z519_12032 [Cladophialophora bantiana CBS 173.52]
MYLSKSKSNRLNLSEAGTRLAQIALALLVWATMCLQASDTPSSPRPATSSPPVVQPVSSSPSPSSSPTSASKPAASTSPASSGGGPTYKASFTHYGSGDSFGSPNCNTNTAACFFYTSPGFSAAVSQNLYGAGPGQGQGPACGTCWKLVGETDSSGNTLSNVGTSIVVMINNLCPADGNPLCAQNGLSGTNQYGPTSTLISAATAVPPRRSLGIVASVLPLVRPRRLIVQSGLELSSIRRAGPDAIPSVPPTSVYDFIPAKPQG